MTTYYVDPVIGRNYYDGQAKTYEGGTRGPKRTITSHDDYDGCAVPDRYNTVDMAIYIKEGTEVFADGNLFASGTSFSLKTYGDYAPAVVMPNCVVTRDSYVVSSPYDFRKRGILPGMKVCLSDVADPEPTPLGNAGCRVAYVGKHYIILKSCQTHAITSGTVTLYFFPPLEQAKLVWRPTTLAFSGCSMSAGSTAITSTSALKPGGNDYLELNARYSQQIFLSQSELTYSKAATNTVRLTGVHGFVGAGTYVGKTIRVNFNSASAGTLLTSGNYVIAAVTSGYVDITYSGVADGVTGTACLPLTTAGYVSSLTNSTITLGSGPTLDALSDVTLYCADAAAQTPQVNTYTTFESDNVTWEGNSIFTHYGYTSHGIVGKSLVFTNGDITWGYNSIIVSTGDYSYIAGATIGAYHLGIKYGTGDFPSTTYQPAVSNSIIEDCVIDMSRTGSAGDGITFHDGYQMGLHNTIRRTTFKEGGENCIDLLGMYGSTVIEDNVFTKEIGQYCASWSGNVVGLQWTTGNWVTLTDDVLGRVLQCSHTNAPAGSPPPTGIILAYDNSSKMIYVRMAGGYTGYWKQAAKAAAYSFVSYAGGNSTLTITINSGEAPERWHGLDQYQTGYPIYLDFGAATTGATLADGWYTVTGTVTEGTGSYTFNILYPSDLSAGATGNVTVTYSIRILPDYTSAQWLTHAPTREVNATGIGCDGADVLCQKLDQHYSTVFRRNRMVCSMAAGCPVYTTAPYSQIYSNIIWGANDTVASGIYVRTEGHHALVVHNLLYMGKKSTRNLIAIGAPYSVVANNVFILDSTGEWTPKDASNYGAFGVVATQGGIADYNVYVGVHRNPGIKGFCDERDVSKVNVHSLWNPPENLLKLTDASDPLKAKIGKGSILFKMGMALHIPLTDINGEAFKSPVVGPFSKPQD